MMGDYRPNHPATVSRQKNVFVLCFDGTGNKFSGTEADSNILKLYRMLDRSHPNIYTFYQPGIGTYITSRSMQTTSTVGKIRSWCSKAKDSAVGSSFGEHVMGGYKFLMRYYSVEDDLYFFGFSRGAYTARFLAEMLDHIGLLSAGNEELIRFAWKTYAKWASRKNDGSPAAIKEEADLYTFMRGFRETFSRPVRRIRFLGLFDTVNSVPKFESAWWQRSRFPYTARSSAKVIRHAVSIDERRARFRQDLISSDQSQREDHMNSNIHRYNSDLANIQSTSNGTEYRAKKEKVATMHPHVEGAETLGCDEGRRIAEKQCGIEMRQTECWLGIPAGHHQRNRSDDSIATPHDPHTENLWSRNRDMSAALSENRSSEDLIRPGSKGAGIDYGLNLRRRQHSGDSRKQDIEEVWFAGGHADIGGGFSRSQGEMWMLSHAPLVWMVHEAANAGLEFDPVKVENHNCHPDRVDNAGERHPCEEQKKKFYDAFEDSYSNGLIHDCLSRNQGSSLGTVAMWNFVEYLPFRRMDLQPDGSWKVIRWPLPMGETRDIPSNAQIHHSVIRRMQSNPDYRPGNLIVGGGGRGIRKAPEKYGIGDWTKYRHHDDPVLETYRRTEPYPQD